MKLSHVQMVSVLVLLGVHQSQAAAQGGDEFSSDIKMQIEILAAEGAITFDADTGKPVIHVDILKKLRNEGRVKVEATAERTTCPGL